MEKVKQPSPAPHRARSFGKVYVGIIIILAAVLIYFVAQGPLAANAQEPAVNSAKAIFSALSENPAEVVSVKEDSGLYKVTMRITTTAGQSTLQDIYVTKDGNFISDKMINVQDYTRQLEREKNFTDCLVAKKVVIAGLSTDANTVSQLQILGNYGYKVFFDCSANQQICQNAGITKTPTTVIGNQTFEGIQPASFYTQATGCTL
jgi:hypothetical protein